MDDDDYAHDEECDHDHEDIEIGDIELTMFDFLPQGEQDSLPWFHFLGFIAMNMLSAFSSAVSVAFIGLASAFGHHGRIKQRKKAAKRLQKDLKLLERDSK